MKNSQAYVCCFGEILWDLLPSGKMPGGAPMNVAIHLQNLGMEVACITRIGRDHLGKELVQFLESKGCETTWVQVDDQHPTGTVKVNISNRTDVQYEIVEPVAWDFIVATSTAIAKVKDAYAIVFGSLACRNPESLDALLRLLENTKAIKVFDVNLRTPHYSKEIVETLLIQADMVKMNEDELAIVSNWFGNASSGFHEKIKQLRSAFNIKTIIVTRGGDGAVLLDESGYYSSKVYRVEVKDTIGSGDSFLAAMIKNLFLKNSPSYSLDYSCALGALVATHHGANPLIKEEEIIQLMNSN